MVMVLCQSDVHTSFVPFAVKFMGWELRHVTEAVAVMHTGRSCSRLVGHRLLPFS